MKSLLSITIILLFVTITLGQTRTVHVFVALCDNENQGIVPVLKSLGYGKNPNSNLYWGALYGVKTFFNKSSDWKLLKTLETENPNVLERLLYKHATKEVYLLADAYDGEKIKNCVEDFLKTSNSQLPVTIIHDTQSLRFDGLADLLAYVGNDGLMDFNINIKYDNKVNKIKDVFILACYSKQYFLPEIKKARANPILWTTHLMAPEAYTLKSAIDGWIDNESGIKKKERAAQAYNKYQKCGINAARNLFTSGF